MKRLRHIILSVTMLLPWCVVAQNVTNVVVQQNGDKIDVSYTLDKEADTYLSVVIDGKYHLCKKVSGDVGANIAAGRRKMTWNVLEDVDSFMGEAYFEVHASKSTKALQAEATAKQRTEKRQKRMTDIYPLAGFDVNAGVYGLGGAVYWPWITTRASRVGSYISYVYASQDWSIDEVDHFHNICLGMTFTVSKHVALFAAPGFSIVVPKDDLRDYDTWDYPSTYYRFAAEGGISFKLLVFTLSAKFAYPNYLGFGVGLDFGWLH